MRIIIVMLALMHGLFSHAEKMPSQTLVELLGSEEQTLQIHREILAAVLQSNPQLSQHQSAIETWARQYISQGEIEKRLAAMYSQFFTDQEIDELIAFYSSDTGAKTILLVPTLMRETRLIGQSLAEEHKGELEAILRR